MRFVKCALTVILCISVCLFCACFSLGVADMDEYNDRFPYVHSISWDFSCTTTDMSDFVGEEDISGESDEDKSELVAVVDVAAYRAIAVEAGDDEDYPSSTISELAVYFYYEGATAVDIEYGIFVSDYLPQDNQAYYSLSEVTSDSSDLYEDGAVIQPLSKDDMLSTGTLSLTSSDDEHWTSIYATFNGKTINAGQYLVIVFFENNDYTVSVTEVTEDDGNGGTVTKYKYTFTEYTDNDGAFSFDKVLLYVSEDDD